MKINFNQKLKTLDGKEVKDNDGKPLTLGSVSVNALLSNIPNEKVDGKEKVRRYELAKTLNRGGSIDVKSEDIVKIKELISQAYTTLIVGQTHELLEKEK